MSDRYLCEKCGADDFCSYVQHGSYTLACKACGWGFATSFIAVDLNGRYRAAIIDDQWRELQPLGEGSGPEFTEMVDRAAREGSKVMLTHLGD
jgi:hypothetical protein